MNIKKMLFFIIVYVTNLMLMIIINPLASVLEGRSKDFYLFIYIIIAILITLYFKKFFESIKMTLDLFRDIIRNKSLIYQLSINDFKTKFVTSNLGILWNFIQPVVTVSIYVFVFQYGFKAAPVTDVPYVLWLVAGIIPWFFFNEALMGATNSLIEYSYLVKKVVFKVDLLPIMKVVSSLFIHMFFILVGVFLYFANNKTLTIHFVQIIYYSICVIALVVAMSYFTSSIIIFFRDIGQIIGVLLQFGMWLTPIMWNVDILSPRFQKLIKFNPVYYITDGYRDAFINKAWFWDKAGQTLYFWSLTIVFMLLGIYVFKKLEKHFVDVM